VAKNDAVEELSAALQRMGRMLASRQVASRIISVAGVEVTQQSMTLMRVLLRDGKQSIATLAAAAAMDLGAVSRQLRLLEDAGAVRRTRSPDDGRVALMELTTSGQRVAERIRAVSVRHLEEALAGWSADDERTLARLMQRLVDDLTATPVRSQGVTAET
jgi:DNA-binding MarR family transcriptional regulator